MLLEYSVEKPLNREPPLNDLVESFITEASTAYDRNHGPIPYIDEDTHKLSIDGAVNRIMELSMSQLRGDFPQHEVIAALQCAGNRRHTMRTELKEVNGIDWNDGAVCNCTWSGPLLCDVLSTVGMKIGGKDVHVAFSCHVTECQDDKYYGSSIFLEQCMDPSCEVILALNMNGAPLTPNHGFPLRVVIPGVAGARWTKWLDRITIQTEESPNYYMKNDYKILPPEVQTAKQAAENWHKVPPLQRMPVNSAICRPASGDTIHADKLPNGELEIAGYALPRGDEGPVVMVEISIDQGKTWEAATIVSPSLDELAEPGAKEKYRWCWTLWKHNLSADKTGRIDRRTKIWSRATDRAGNAQKLEDVRWNFRGVGYNGFGEVKGLNVIHRDGDQSTTTKIVTARRNRDRKVPFGCKI